MKKTQKYTGTKVELKSKKFRGEGTDQIYINLPNGDSLRIMTWADKSMGTDVYIHTYEKESYLDDEPFINKGMNCKSISTGTRRTHVHTFTRLNNNK